MSKAVTITRHMATIAGARQVHYRRAGSGPPLILMHQSPASSREFLPLLSEFADEFTVIAPDTPGNGLSEPLACEAPTMADFADAVAGLMDELGIERALVYGFHTGASCALALAHRHSRRVVAGIANGYCHLTPDELADFLENYLPVMPLDWSGAHLTWAWARIREQFMFFPWYGKSDATRLRVDIPPTRQIHELVLDLLRAGDNYRIPYRAAFTYSPAIAVAEMAAKMVIMTQKNDVLYPCLDRLPATSPTVTVQRPDDFAGAKLELMQILRANRGHESAPPPAPTRPIPGRIWSQYLPISGASLYCRRNTDVAGRPIVFTHPTASSSLEMQRFMTPLLGKRPLLAVDLPGNGESDNPFGKEVTVEAQATSLAHAIRAAGYEEVDVFALGGGGCVALELALAAPGLVRRIAMQGLPLLDEAARMDHLTNEARSTALEEFGAHLIRVWNTVRDRQLFAPWFSRKRENVISPDASRLEVRLVHERALDMLKCLDICAELHAAHLCYPVQQKLSLARCPILLGEAQDCTGHHALARNGGFLDRRRLPNDPESLAAEILTFFDRP